MTSINTQLTPVGVNLNSALPPKQSNEPALAAVDNASQIKSTTLTISEDAKTEYSVPYNKEEGYDPSKPGLIGLQIMSAEDQSARWRKEDMEYHIQPTFSADAALTKVNREMIYLQHKIEAVKPELLGKKWDFVLKGDKIEVTGSKLTADEKQWLENNLNRNKTVLGAVKDFYAAVVKNYDHTEDHPSSVDGGNGKNVFAYGVAEQIDGKLQIKSIMDQVTAKIRGSIVNNANPFMKSMEVAGSYLKTSDQATYFQSNADMTDPETAAYMKAHPDLQRI